MTGLNTGYAYPLAQGYPPVGAMYPAVGGAFPPVGGIYPPVSAPIGFPPLAGGQFSNPGQALLAQMGVNPPSMWGEIAKGAAIFGGIGLAGGLAASLLPGIGPILGVIAGAAGVLVGAFKGYSDYNTKHGEYELHLRHLRDQANTPKPIETVVDRMMSILDIDGDGSITVDAFPTGLQDLLRRIDTAGDKNGTVTRFEIASVIRASDDNGDGKVTADELKDLHSPVSGSPVVLPPPLQETPPTSTPPAVPGPPTPVTPSAATDPTSGDVPVLTMPDIPPSTPDAGTSVSTPVLTHP